MSTRHIRAFACVRCSRSFPSDRVEFFTCPDCGPEGTLDVIYDLERVRRDLPRDGFSGGPPTHWRYRLLLPIGDKAPIPNLRVGWTPLYASDRLAKEVGVDELWIKDDGRNPTASFKDRASSVGVVKALEAEASAIACASTGNAASSLAGFSAAMGLPAYIFVPDRAPAPKVTQLLIYGATVIQVQATYDEAYDLCQSACPEYGWYNRNCAVNPYLVEGKKTCGLEIAEQMGEKIVDWVIVSVGDGCTISGIWKGLHEMHSLGFIPKLPRLLAVQAEGAHPVMTAFDSGNDLVPVETTTLADSIAVGTPRNWRKAVRSVRQSKGRFVAVSDEAILEAMRLLARKAGVFGEPAGVAGLAGLKRARERRIIRPGDRVLLVVTGNGLKDVASARKAAESEPLPVAPNLEALRNALT